VRGRRPDTVQGWADLIATMTAFTARTIVDAYERWILPCGLDEVFVTGGGARNPVLCRMLADGLAPIPVRTGEALGGLDPDAKEAVAFAALAWAHAVGAAGNIPTATGAAGPRILGSSTPGRAP
jgi:anhydro-N-acetylmuramic acid kinase